MCISVSQKLNCHVRNVCTVVVKNDILARTVRIHDKMQRVRLTHTHY